MPAFTGDQGLENPATPDEDQPLHRNPRVVEQHLAIPEEDESADTASEPPEPVTPTSDAAPSFPHIRRHDEPVTKDQQPDQGAQFSSLAVPGPAQGPAAERPQPIHKRTLSGLKMSGADGAADKAGTPEKPKLGRRVGSYVRSKLHRNSSPKDPPQDGQPSEPQPLKPLPQERVLVKTGVDGPKEVSGPAVVIPKTRRFSSFGLSARSTPKSSRANSPPSPGSPTSTISDPIDKEVKDEPLAKTQSSTAVVQMTRPGVRWAGGGKGGSRKHSSLARRRSASTESVPRSSSHTVNTIGLIDTFSKPAVEGVGLKARRLSISLPDEFVVDDCELDKEFKSSSLMPGKRGKVLGRGATAEVRIMARRDTVTGEELVAVKEFRGREKDEDEQEYIMKIKSEYSIAKSLHHPNIVETVRLCHNRGRWNHVMEYCRHGEMFSLVDRKLFSAGPEGHYSVQDRLCFFKQLLRGVDYLHAHGIAHRDIKLENLLLDKDGHLKISDFGVAEVFSGEHPGLRQAGGECGKNMGEIRLSKPGICGSLPYIAPEVLEKKGEYDPRPLDIWSCAIVFLTMTFGGCPWQAAKTDYEYYATFKKGWDDWLETHPDGQITDSPDGHPKCGKLFSLINPPPIKRLILKMLHPLPEMRVTIREIMNSPCVKSIDCCCPESFEDTTCCRIDASKNSSTNGKNKVFLHHHIPPAQEKKIAKAFSHRFDMGNGW